MTTKQTVCFHCHEPQPSDCNLSVIINNKEQPMCCIGCQAVAQTIIDNGLEGYYQHREGDTQKLKQLVPEQLRIYDNLEVSQDFVHHEAQECQVLLSVDGISCAACAWLIEKRLQTQEGIRSVKVNTSTHRAQITWLEGQTQLSDIISQISTVGYHAYPFQPDVQELHFKEQYKSFLKRLGIAGIASMQVMMFAIALYGGLLGDMEIVYRDFLRWVSLLMATPVILYSAQPFYINAYKGLRSAVLGMDLPVSIALLGAYFASAYATFTGTGEVYFESVSMFTFFLLLGRFLELRVRRQASEYSANLLKLIPIIAHRLNALGQTEDVAAKSLKLDDVVQISPGEAIPADGIIIYGSSNINESLLTGEHLPITKSLDQTVYAGSINGEGLLKVKVTALSGRNLISTIVRLQEQAQNTKPKIGLIADKIARYFVAILLILATATYIFWMSKQPEDAFWITLTVLVATCPCALSLATPAALTSATSHLSRLGLLIRNGNLLETLAQINTIRFDKTGTLTKGDFEIEESHVYSSDLSKDQVLAIAAELESVSRHPIANAFSPYKNNDYNLDAINASSGLGISANYQGNTYKIGSANYLELTDVTNHDQGKLITYLSCNDKLIAHFILDDPLRDDSQETVQYFINQGFDCAILSGDASSHVDKIANQLNLPVFKACSPKQKLAHIQALNANNKQTLMLGDGINDSPVMAAATLSIAMGDGADLAKSSSDGVLLGAHLNSLFQAYNLAKKCKKIIIQNLSWALGYNLIIVPLAMMGMVSPYLAVIGMSVSSLIVVTNSLRLAK